MRYWATNKSCWDISNKSTRQRIKLHHQYFRLYYEIDIIWTLGGADFWNPVTIAFNLNVSFSQVVVIRSLPLNGTLRRMRTSLVPTSTSPIPRLRSRWRNIWPICSWGNVGGIAECFLPINSPIWSSTTTCPLSPGSRDLISSKSICSSEVLLYSERENYAFDLSKV